MDFGQISKKSEEEDMIDQVIERHLRYLMLYQTFDKIKKESTEQIKEMLQIDARQKTAQLNLDVGNIINLSIVLTFFSSESELVQPSESHSLVKPSFFKQMFQLVVENTFSPSIMKNLGFLLAQKTLTEVF